MRLVLALAALAASASVTSAANYTPRPKCTPAGTKQFVDALNTASNGCTATNTYEWDGNNDPTNDQRTAFCNCDVAPFNIPMCSWTKAVYNVSVNEHFHYVFNCDSLGGKQAPNVTEVPAQVGTVAPSAAPTTAPSASGACNEVQMSMFTTSLKSSSSCIAASSYDWSGSADPTDAQFSEICKCSVSSAPSIPTCTLTKAGTKVSLSEHYNWILNTKCPQITGVSKSTSGGTSGTAGTSGTGGTGTTTGGTEKKSSSNTAMIAGIIGGAVVLVALIIGFVIAKRKRSAKSDANDMRSPATYQPMEATPQSNNKSNGGVATVATTITTTNGSMNPSGNGTGSYGTGASGRSTETGKWDDPVIMAVRIPFDSIFVGALLSKGGFGEVHRGTYRGETVAIKSLLPERRKDLTQIDDFLSEVKLMSTLQHERIVKFIGVAWNSLSDACMVVEYMENGDLRSLLSRWESGQEQRPNGFDADKVKIAMHVAHALVYLHSLSPVVVHRDLKSKNVLLDANLDAKLTDFGISRERADATMTAGVGSSLWMAPEVMMGQRYDEKADIFSFGVVLSELDTHQLPYFHAKVTETGQKLPEAAILQQVMLGRISVGFTDRAHPELVKLGRECVSVDPKQRPTTAQVLHRVHTIMREFQ